jgi:predicted unusual protein kinase regulating ubiquinone biosynthesis (AarF/ABC1/UbiB family)
MSACAATDRRSLALAPASVAGASVRVPAGLFVEEVVEVAREELKLECNYTLEAANQERFRALVEADPSLAQRVSVPAVVHDLVTTQVTCRCEVVSEVVVTTSQ